MLPYQPGILAPIPAAARHLRFNLADAAPQAVRAALERLRGDVDGESAVVGLGLPLIEALDVHLPVLGAFPEIVSDAAPVPSTPAALWCWLRGGDQGVLLHRARRIKHLLAPALIPIQDQEAFRYQGGLDLTGYEDGTENPQGEEALAAAFAQGQGEGRDGSSIAALQQWVHDLDRFEAMSPTDQDNSVGRRKFDNEELDDAPESAHVKRTAQESFEPEAFVLRRSMPWAEAGKAGLMFLSFGKDAQAFEAQLRRMTGQEDGIVDALFQYTKPVTGSYFWCPPLRDGRLDLRALGL